MLGSLIRVGAAGALALTCAVSLSLSSSAADDCEVKIGTAGPLTGSASAWGLAVRSGTEFVAALTNEDGGLKVGNRKCKVKVLSFDAQYTAAGGAAAANYMASEGVHAVDGPVGSPETTGFKPVAARAGIVNISSSYSKDAIQPEYPLAFHQMQGPPAWGPAIIKAARERVKFKTVLLVAPNDQGGTDGAKALAKLYGDQGVRTVEDYYQRGTTNFAPIAARIMAENPDSVETSTMPPADTEQLTRELIEAGYSGAFGRLGGGGGGPILAGAGGAGNLKAFYYLTLVAVDEPGVKQLRTDYERIMKTPPPVNELLYTSTNATEQLLRAISAAGTDSDGEKIADALRKLSPESRYLGKEGWRGRTQFGINQELAFPVGLGIIVDGKNLGVTKIDIPSEP